VKTGHKIVDEISNLNYKGNTIPNTWYSHIKRKTEKGNFKTDLLAVNILADIIFWYRAYEERDEETGRTLSFNKKFKEDMYQKWYKSWEEMFGVTKRQIRNSIRLLIDFDLIRREIRTIKTKNGLILTGVTFFEPNPKRIEYINNAIPDKDRPLYEIVYTPIQNCKGGSTKKEGGHDNFVHHTKITTENPTESSTNTCTPDFKKSDDVGCNVSDAQGMENPFFKKYKEIKNIIKNKKYEKLKNTKNKNIGDIKKFNRGQDRLGNKDPIEISAALKIYDEIDLQEHSLLVEYIKHETKLWDYSNTENVNFVRGIFIIECVYQADTFLHFCALKEKGILNIELKNIPKKAQKKKGSLLDQWRAQA
jgi:hypothetical protein